MVKKSKVVSENKCIAPLEAIQFLEDIRKMSSHVDEPTEAISLRIPGNLLRTLRVKAKIEGKKYQSLLIEILRKELQK